MKHQHTKELERIASLSTQEARDIVLKRGEEEATHELARRYYELEKEHQTRADDNARRILTLAINRLATDVVSESTTSVVSLPNDEMKGRLIGREGRNIRALEAAPVLTSSLMTPPALLLYPVSTRFAGKSPSWPLPNWLRTGAFSPPALRRVSTAPSATLTKPSGAPAKRLPLKLASADLTPS